MAGPRLREQILVAGVRVLHEGGYHATGVQQIVDAARVPKGSFYNHFPSKEALAAAALDRYFEDHRRLLKGILVDDGHSPLERLQDYFKRVERLFKVDEFRRGCMIGNFGLEVADHSALLRSRTTALLAELTGTVESGLRQARHSGEINKDADLHALAEFVVNSWEGAILRMKVDKSVRPLRIFRQHLFGTLLRRPDRASRRRKG